MENKSSLQNILFGKYIKNLRYMFFLPYKFSPSLKLCLFNTIDSMFYKDAFLHKIKVILLHSTCPSVFLNLSENVYFDVRNESTWNPGKQLGLDFDKNNFKFFEIHTVEIGGDWERHRLMHFLLFLTVQWLQNSPFLKNFKYVTVD